MLGGGLAFILEQMDEAIDDPSEIERMLGLPLLDPSRKRQKSRRRNLEIVNRKLWTPI